MAYETGTAQNERDLLDKINTFLTTNQELVRDGQAWTVLLDRTLDATPTRKAIRQIAWKSTGTGVEQDIYLCASTENLIAQDTFNINFWGGTFFNSQFVTATEIENGLVNPSPGVVLFADDRPIEYHIVASGRCCKIVTRISQVCSSAYLGFILPTVPPTEYPYPLCVAGSTTLKRGDYRELTRYSRSDDFVSSIVDPRYNNCWLMTPDQAWRDFHGSTYENLTPDSGNQRLHPLNEFRGQKHNQPFLLDRFGPASDGAYPLIPVEFFSSTASSQGANRWGAYDGVYWVPGLQRASGDTVTSDNFKGIVFNGAFRVSVRDFFVIETGA
ncbi:hypothetical protein PcPA57_13510 [Pasteurella canis]|uniref:hypothetical protein n=1 Tax=Pasteurella canis TaxID=753 RepID=UPI001E5B9755|nr:hypothetical protein [Pasteurella canis]GJJ80631.1 hypothetical protein PcPA57_13510 [Pasteurella canis]